MDKLDLHARIVRLAQARRETIEQTALAVGTTSASVRRHRLKPHTKLRPQVWRKLEELEKSSGFDSAGGEKKTPGVQSPEIVIWTKAEWEKGTKDRLSFQVQLPVLNDAAAAGSPRTINERDIESFVAIPQKFVPKGLGHYTGIYVRGDSMEPVLQDRFIVVVDHESKNHMRLKNHIVAALHEDGVVVKRIAPESKKDAIILRSENRQYDDIVIREPETNPIIGRVVFWWGTQSADPRPIIEDASARAGVSPAFPGLSDPQFTNALAVAAAQAASAILGPFLKDLAAELAAWRKHADQQSATSRRDTTKLIAQSDSVITLVKNLASQSKPRQGD